MAKKIIEGKGKESKGKERKGKNVKSHLKKQSTFFVARLLCANDIKQLELCAVVK